MTTSFEKRDIVVDGVRSPVLIGGSATTPRQAVVFVHGNPGPGADWEPLMTPVAEFARVVVPDMPGFGDAEKPAEWGYTVAAYADHLDGVLDHLGIERVHLVAHDLGGPFALAWAAGHLDRVASIALINTPVVIDHTLSRLWRTPVVGELAGMMSNPRLLKPVLRRQNAGLSDEALDRITRQAQTPGVWRTVLRFYRATGKQPIEAYTEELKKFAGEVLVVWGDNDSYLPVEQADQQRRIFRHAQLELVPGAGHWPWHEQPDRVVPRVTEFLRRQTADSSGGGTA